MGHHVSHVQEGRFCSDDFSLAGNLQVVTDPTSQLLMQAQQLAQQQAAQQVAAQQMAQQQAYLVGLQTSTLGPATSPTIYPSVLPTDTLGLTVSVCEHCLL